MQIRAVASAAGRDAFREHLENSVEVSGGRSRRDRRGGSGEQLLLAPFLRGTRRHDLLRQHVERRVGNDEAVEIAVPDRAHQRRALDQVVARGGEEASLGNRAAPVAGAADALQGDGNRARRTDLAHQIDGADVDAEFERRGRDQHFHLAVLQFLFGREAQLAREAAVMRGDIVFAEPLAQMVRDALGQRRVFTKTSVERCCSTSSMMRS